VVKKKPSYTAVGNANWCNHSGKQYGNFFKKLNTGLPYNPAISLLTMYPKECDSGYLEAPAHPYLLQCYSQ
jgi:hypothetical protein